MSTRSAIGYALPSGNVRAVYCHWDGYPSHHLPILEQHYNTLPKVRALVKPGSMSCLRTSETWESDYPRDANGKADFGGSRTEQRPAQPLYHRERGDGEPPKTTSDADAPKFWEHQGCEHLYIFRPGYGWFHYEL